MSQLRFMLTLPLSLLVFLISINAWAQPGLSYRLHELRQTAADVQRLAQAIEAETRYSYRSGLGLEAAELARAADYFRSSLDSFQFNEVQVRSDFNALVRNYRQVIAYEGSIWGNYQLSRLLGDLRLAVDRLVVIFQVQQHDTIFAHRQVIRLANRIDQNATTLFRSVEQDLSRYGRFGYAEREAIRTLLDLAVAARHLETQVSRLFQNAEHTRRDADEVVRRYNNAETQLAYLPLSTQAREAFTRLSYDIYELQSLYGVNGGRDPYTHNDPFGRGGNYGPGPAPIPGPGYHGPAPIPGPGIPGPGHFDDFNPCIDPVLCGPPRGTAPSVRIF